MDVVSRLNENSRGIRTFQDVAEFPAVFRLLLKVSQEYLFYRRIGESANFIEGRK